MIDFDEVSEIQLELFAELAKKELEPAMLIQYGNLLVNSYTKAQTVLASGPSDKEKWVEMLNKAKEGFDILILQIKETLNCSGYCNERELLQIAHLLTKIQYLEELKEKTNKKISEQKQKKIEAKEKEGQLLDISVFDKIELD